MSNNLNPPTKTEKTEEKSKTKNFSITGLDKLRYYLVTIIIIVISAALIMLVALPSYKNIGKNKEKISKNQADYAKIKAQADYLEQLSNIKDEIESNKDLAVKAMPEEDLIPEMFNQIIQIAELSNVEIGQLSYSGKTANEVDGYTSVKAQVSVKGDLESIILFLTNMENSLRVFSPENLSIKINNEGLEDTIELSFSVSSYFMPKVQTDNVSIDQIMQKPRLESVINLLNQKQYYEPVPMEIQTGKENPFTQGGSGSIKTIPIVPVSNCAGVDNLECPVGFSCQLNTINKPELGGKCVLE